MGNGPHHVVNTGLKSTEYWFFKGRIQLYIQWVLPLCLIFRPYNIGSAKLMVLCIILVPHAAPQVRLMLGFSWTVTLVPGCAKGVLL